MRDPESRAIGLLLGWVALLTTVVVTPWASFDPINVPKLAVICVGGFMALGVLCANRKAIWDSKYRTVSVLVTAFLIHLTLVLFISGTNFSQEFFGTAGRSTGYLAYVGLLFLLLGAAISAGIFSLKSVSLSLIVAGFLSIIYGVAQSAGLDPIKWANPYTPVIGFLGNPNFQS